MATLPATRKKKVLSTAPRIVAAYDIAADAKKRISLRRAGAKYFHVKAFSNGSYLLEPRALVPMKVRIDRIEVVQPSPRVRPLMRQLGRVLDRLPAR